MEVDIVDGSSHGLNQDLILISFLFGSISGQYVDVTDNGNESSSQSIPGIPDGLDNPD